MRRVVFKIRSRRVPVLPADRTATNRARGGPDIICGYLPGRDNDIPLDTGRRHTAIARFVGYTHICVLLQLSILRMKREPSSRKNFIKKAIFHCFGRWYASVRDEVDGSRGRFVENDSGKTNCAGAPRLWNQICLTVSIYSDIELYIDFIPS